MRSAQRRAALVTGGAGFIGGHLVERLVADGWQVRVLDDFSTGRESNLERVADRIDLLRGDVRDARTVARAVEGVEVVFHQAAIASVPRSVADPIGTHAVNTLGTLQVLEAARDAGVRRVVYAASCAIYGDGSELPKRETLPPRPLSPYALQKHAGELTCRLYARLHGLETVALRYFNVYGPRQDPNGDYAAVIPRFITACLAGAAPRVYGDGEQTRDFVAVRDVVAANLLAAEAEKASGCVCNVASGRETSLNELLALVREHTGATAAARYDPPREGDVRRSVACLDHAQESLGYAPRVALREGLVDTIASFAAAARGSFS
ncbi:MAG: SDR family oxidoreductase [Myxococcales bacterium]|nr:SDR family oxidoreductase [Myxococcales bacterium]